MKKVVFTGSRLFMKFPNLEYFVERLKGMAEFKLPEGIRYLELESISTEARQKLDAIRPESLAQAGRIPGVSPSDLQNLLVEVLRMRERKK